MRVADGEDAAELILANIRVLEGLGAIIRRSFTWACWPKRTFALAGRARVSRLWRRRSGLSPRRASAGTSQSCTGSKANSRLRPAGRAMRRG